MTTEQKLTEAQDNLKKAQEHLESLQKELKNEVKRWNPGFYDDYYFVDQSGRLQKSVYTIDRYDLKNFRYSQRNVFKTEEEAKKHLEYLNALAVVRYDAEDFEPDWKDYSQKKYFVHFDHALNDLHIEYEYYQKTVTYFKSHQAAQKSIEKHRKEWLTVFGIEGDK